MDQHDQSNFMAMQRAGLDEDFIEASQLASKTLNDDITGHHEYSFDQVTRDRLLAHGRQDASHAVVNDLAIMKRLRSVERLQKWVIGLSIVAALLAILNLVW